MAPSSIRRPRRKRPESSLFARLWWVGLLAVAIVVGVLTFRMRPDGARHPFILTGYITSVMSLEQEYARYQGRLLKDPEVQRQFEQAGALMSKHDYSGAAALLEAVSKKAAVPVVFNNLGVLYAELQDRSRTVNAFREALSRDTSYRPVRNNMERLRNFTGESAEPVTREIEPNGNNELANVMGLDIPVDAEISSDADLDCYKFTSPPSPRDLLILEIANHSPSLELGLRIYDSDQRLLDYGKTEGQPGASITRQLAPPPNSTWYIQIWGYRGSSGPYVVKVRPAHASDAFEPNDDIFSASKITVGQTIDANIMDTDDTDYFTFVSPRTGTVQIDLQNHSATLIPAITTFSSDRRNTGFGPDVRAGAGLHHVIPVAEGQTYYFQIFSQANTFGAYSLTIQ
jgi:hypothetical protein